MWLIATCIVQALDGFCLDCCSSFSGPWAIEISSCCKNKIGAVLLTCGVHWLVTKSLIAFGLWLCLCRHCYMKMCRLDWLEAYLGLERWRFHSTCWISAKSASCHVPSAACCCWMWCSYYLHLHLVGPDAVLVAWPAVSKHWIHSRQPVPLSSVLCI